MKPLIFNDERPSENGTSQGASELKALLGDLVSSVNAFMESCSSEHVKIPFLPCEVLMWAMKDKIMAAEIALGLRPND